MKRIDVKKTAIYTIEFTDKELDQIIVFIEILAAQAEKGIQNAMHGGRPEKEIVEVKRRHESILDILADWRNVRDE